MKEPRAKSVQTVASKNRQPLKSICYSGKKCRKEFNPFFRNANRYLIWSLLGEASRCKISVLANRQSFDWLKKPCKSGAKRNSGKISLGQNFDYVNLSRLPVRPGAVFFVGK